VSSHALAIAKARIREMDYRHVEETDPTAEDKQRAGEVFFRKARFLWAPLRPTSSCRLPAGGEAPLEVIDAYL